MPQLPRAEDITRSAPTGTQRITMRDTGSQYQALTSVGRALQGAVDEVTDWQIAKAKAAFLTQKAKEDNAYDRDNDYATMPTRYQDNMNNALQSAGELISSPRARNLFMTEAGVDIAQGTQRISGIARQEEQRQNVAFIEEHMVGLQEAAMTGDPTTAMRTAQELVATAVARGDVQEDQAGNIMRNWSTQTLKSRIEAMEPARRLEELDKPWADKLPTGIRVQLRNEADRLLVDEKAMDVVDSYFQQNLSYADSQAELTKIQDPDLRKAAEARFETQFNKLERANNIEQEDIFDEYGPNVRDGLMRVLDIPVEARERMNTQVLDSLYRAEQAAGTRTLSDREVTDKLNQMYADGTGNASEVRRYFMEHSDQLSDTDYKVWSQVTSKPTEDGTGFEGLENDPFFTGTQRVKSYMTEMLGEDLDKDRAPVLEARLQNKLSQYVYDYREQNGRDPSGPEQDTFLRDQFFSMPTRESRVPFDESPAGYKPWEGMSPVEKDRSLNYIKDVMPDVYESAVSILTEGGTYELDRDELADLLSRVNMDNL